MPDAFRYVPVNPVDHDVSIVALLHPKKSTVVFLELYGLAFGLSEAVPAFNRKPFLYVAIVRRFLAMVIDMYFDEASVLDLSSAKGAGHNCVAKLFALLGSPFKDSKTIACPFDGISWVLSTTSVGLCARRSYG